MMSFFKLLAPATDAMLVKSADCLISFIELLPYDFTRL